MLGRTLIVEAAPWILHYWLCNTTHDAKSSLFRWEVLAPSKQRPVIFWHFWQYENTYCSPWRLHLEICQFCGQWQQRQRQTDRPITSCTCVQGNYTKFNSLLSTKQGPLMLEIVLFYQPCLLTTSSTGLYFCHRHCHCWHENCQILRYRCLSEWPVVSRCHNGEKAMRLCF